MQAFAETEDSAVGESIYTPSSSCLSITDSLDLSLVKVYQDKVERCEFGLRNSEDKLVKGNISVADQSEMYDMKLYKWGAKTKLTKGIYKVRFLSRKEKNLIVISIISKAVLKNKYLRRKETVDR